MEILILIAIVVVFVIVFLSLKNKKKKPPKEPKGPGEQIAYKPLLNEIYTVVTGLRGSGQPDAEQKIQKYLKSIANRVERYMHIKDFRDRYNAIIEE